MAVRNSSLRDPTVLWILIVLFCSIYSVWNPASKKLAIDFYQFWVVGQEVADGQAGNIYSEVERERIGRSHLEQARASNEPVRLETARHRSDLDTFSTPFLYTVFGAFSSGDYLHDLSVYRVLSLSCLAASVAALCALLGYGIPGSLIAILLLSCWYAPSRSDVIVGNVNHFQLGLLSLFLWLSCRHPTTLGDVAGGVLLGLAVMFKPNSALIIGLLAVSWLVRRQKRKFVLEMAGVASGVFLAFVWSSLAFGDVGIWWSWIAALSNLPSDLISVELGNYAPARLLSETMNVEASWLILLVCGGLSVAAVMRGRSNGQEADVDARSGFEDIQVAALASLVTLLAAPLSWLHYFVAAIPMLLVTLRPMNGEHAAGRGWAIPRVAGFVALLAIMIQPMTMLGLGEPVDRAVFLCVGTVVLFLVGVAELFGGRPDFADPSEAD